MKFDFKFRKLLKLLYRAPSKIIKTPLHIACEKNNHEIVELLLKNPKIDVNSYIEIRP